MARRTLLWGLASLASALAADASRLQFAAPSELQPAESALAADASRQQPAAAAPLVRANEVPQVAVPWRGTTVNDLFSEYGNIFKHGNRNAASHLWVRFLLERSEQMTHDQLAYMFSGFCAVSGSPVRPSDYNRYKLTLDRVDGAGKVQGFMHYCCWPCVCDTQDFIRVDTRTVKTADGERSYRFAVIGNPCDRASELKKPFQDAFGRGVSTLERDAPEVRCKDGELQGAPLSDNGYVIINMFFDHPAEDVEQGAVAAARGQQQPGRISEIGGVKFQDEAEFESMCEERKLGGYRSGMGEIFRRVAGISPIQIAVGALEDDNETACAALDGPGACGAEAAAAKLAAPDGGAQQGSPAELR